jgi:DnaJ-class molecular chaperone
MEIDYYEVLGVSGSASSDGIKKAYRKLKQKRSSSRPQRRTKFSAIAANARYMIPTALRG